MLPLNICTYLTDMQWASNQNLHFNWHKTAPHFWPESIFPGWEWSEKEIM